MALVEIIFRDRVGGYKRGQVTTLNSETPFFKAVIQGNKAEVVNPPDWEFGDDKPIETVEVVKIVTIKEDTDGSESDSEPIETSEPAQPRSSRQSRKKSAKSSDEASKHSSENDGGPSELVESGDSEYSGQDAGEDSLGRSEYQSDSEWDSWSV